VSGIIASGSGVEVGLPHVTALGFSGGGKVKSFAGCFVGFLLH